MLQSVQTLGHVAGAAEKKSAVFQKSTEGCPRSSGVEFSVTAGLSCPFKDPGMRNAPCGPEKHRGHDLVEVAFHPALKTSPENNIE